MLVEDDKLFGSAVQGGAQDRVRLLDIGADDYMVKPIDLGELCARVRAVSRRSIPTTSDADIAYGALRLCPARRLVLWRDRRASCRAAESGSSCHAISGEHAAMISSADLFGMVDPICKTQVDGNSTHRARTVRVQSGSAF